MNPFTSYTQAVDEMPDCLLFDFDDLTYASIADLITYVSGQIELHDDGEPCCMSSRRERLIAGDYLQQLYCSQEAR